jgi:hydrogenase maturation protease
MLMPLGLSTKPHTLIIGIGNEYRRDDAAGLVVARRLHEKKLARVSVVEQSGEGANLIEQWKGTESVILVDAVHSGSAPGTIFRFDAAVEPIPAKFFHYSTHAFSVAEAVELARALNQLPPHLLIYGIEGKNFESGVELSFEIEKAIGEAVERITQEI